MSRGRSTLIPVFIVLLVRTILTRYRSFAMSRLVVSVIKFRHLVVLALVLVRLLIRLRVLVFVVVLIVLVVSIFVVIMTLMFRVRVVVPLVLVPFVSRRTRLRIFCPRVVVMKSVP